MIIARACSAIALLFLAVGCTADETGPDEGAADAVRIQPGDYHLETRSSDEARLRDGAILDMRLTVDGDECAYDLLQAAGGCDGSDPDKCFDLDILFDAKKQTRTSGACEIADGALILTLEDGRTRKYNVTKFSKGDDDGFELKAKLKVSEAGSKFFLARNSTDPFDIAARAFDVEFVPVLSQPIELDDAKLSDKVRAALEKVVDDLTISEDDFSSDVDAIAGLLASPFDTEPAEFAVSSTHNGDHCGGFKVIVVDLNGKEVDELSDGDCGF